MKKGTIRQHDILMVKDGATTGKVAFVDESFPFKKAAVNEHVFIIRPSESRILPRYLFFFLYSLQGQAQVLSTYHGAAQGGIKTSFAEKVSVPIPSIGEQREIVRFLDFFDRRIEKFIHSRRRLVELLNE